METVKKQFLILAGALIGLTILVYVVCGFVVRKGRPTLATIRTRRVLMQVGSYLLATSLCSLLPLIQSLYPGFLGTPFNPEEFIPSFMQMSLIATTLVFLNVGIIRRFILPIRTPKEIRQIDNYILFLRSFQSDKASIEKRFNRILKTIAPVYAVGDPGRLLQPVGATRVYIPHDEWKEAVLKMCEDSRFIFMRVSQTEGTVWEIGTILENQLVAKTLFLVQDKKDYDYLSLLLGRHGYPALPDCRIMHCVAIYMKTDTPEWQVTEVGKKDEIAEMIAGFIREREDLVSYYGKHVKVSHHPFLHLFDKSIPGSVRWMPYWNMFSPVVAMRHWSWQAWGLFLSSVIVSTAIQSWIPVSVAILFFFLFGRRIEWLQTIPAGRRPFNRQLRRELFLMVYSACIGALFGVIYSFASISNL